MRRLQASAFTGVLVAAMSSLTASAADLGSLKDTPIVMPAPTWSGIYFGTSGGYGHNRSKNNYSDSTGASSSVAESASGGFVSAIVGFDRQFRDRFVLGAFADFDVSDLDRGNDDARNGLTISRAWAVGGRVGYLVTPGLMVFATGGYTEAHFRNYGWWDILANGVGPNLPGHRSRDFGGYFVGGGLEMMLRHGFFLRGEVRYADYREGITNAGTFGPDTYVDAEDAEILTVRLGITYKMGHDQHQSPAGGGLKDPFSGGYEHAYKVVTINGVDFSQGAWAAYSYNLFALNGDFNREGLRFRSLGVLVDYSYKDNLAPQTKYSARDRSLDIMLGYQKIFSHFTASAYLGYEVRDADIWPNDFTNKVRGTTSGVKLAFELESKDDAKVYFAVDGSYSTAFDSIYGEARIGYNAGRFIIGPEAAYFSDEGDATKRLGAFLKVPFMLAPTRAAEVTAHGGYQFVDDNRTGTGAGGTHGGEGAYGGLSLKMAF